VTFTINQKYAVAAVVVVMFVASIFGMGLVKKQFFPISDRPEVLVEVLTPQGASIDLTSKAATKIENWLKKQKEPEVVTTYVGGGGARFFISYNPELPNPNFSKIIVRTANANAREALILKLRKAASDGLAPEAQIRILRFYFGPPTPWPVTIRVLGPDLDKLRKFADEAESIIRKNPHTRTVNQDWGQLSHVYHFKLDQTRLNAIGLSTTDVSEQLQFLLTGYSVTQVREDIRKVDIVARALPVERLDPTKMDSLNSQTTRSYTHHHNRRRCARRHATS
jgi:multidrug efflux pump subunit AcrB